MTTLAQMKGYIFNDKSQIRICKHMWTCHKNKCQLLPASKQEVTIFCGLIIKLIVLEKDRLDQCVMASSAKPDELPTVSPQESHSRRRKPDPEDLL